MNTTVISFFNNKGGVGKTSLVYHLSWMFSGLGLRTLAADLDPQANLSSAFLSEEEFETLFEREPSAPPATIYGALRPLIEGYGDVQLPELHAADDTLSLIPGDLLLSTFEDQLSETWPKCSNGDVRAFRVTTAFWRVIQAAADHMQAELVLVDLGPNLGAINRAALISSDYVVIPLAPDLFSLQGLRNLGPRLRDWRGDWREKLKKFPGGNFQLPVGKIQPAGYVVQQHAVRLDRPVKAYGRWMNRIPGECHEALLASQPQTVVTVANDPNCLATLKNYRSLMPLAHEARKPMFQLKAADGALGSHALAAQDAYRDFKQLALKIAQSCSIAVPESGAELAPAQPSLFG
jgi:cellulose biosynthesis protein BcsQ